MYQPLFLFYQYYTLEMKSNQEKIIKKYNSTKYYTLLLYDIFGDRI